MLGLGLGLASIQGLADPASLFAGRVGVQLDPSRLDTLFQDAAGTTPANAPGQPIGLVRDLSGGGRHVSQAVSASRPTLGRHPRSGRRNQLLNSRALASSGWSAGNFLTLANAGAIGLSGQMTACLMIENTATTPSRNRVQGLNVITGQFYTMSAIVKSLGPQQRHAYLVYENGTSFSGNPMAVLNMVTGAITQAGGVDRTVGAENLGNGWWKLWLRCRCIADGLNGFRVGFSDSPTSPWGSYTGDGLSGMAVDNVQVETGAGVTAQQITTTQYDIAEAGQPDLWYVSTDAVDDFLATANFEWATDEVTIVAAIRKRSDAAEGSLVNFGDFGTTGAFGVAGPGGTPASERLWSLSRGNAQTFAITGDAAFAAPLDAVLVMQGKIGTDLNVLEINGVQVASNSSDQGAATTYGNRQLFIGRRNGTAVPGAFDIYAFLAINKVLAPAELALAKRWAAEKRGTAL